MQQITLTAPLVGQFIASGHPIEILDEAGHRLGHFVPQVVSADACPYSAAELAAMKAEQSGRPLSEVWQSLGDR